MPFCIKITIFFKSPVFFMPKSGNPTCIACFYQLRQLRAVRLIRCMCIACTCIPCNQTGLLQQLARRHLRHIRQLQSVHCTVNIKYTSVGKMQNFIFHILLFVISAFHLFPQMHPLAFSYIELHLPGRRPFSQQPKILLKEHFCCLDCSVHPIYYAIFQ